MASFKWGWKGRTSRGAGGQASVEMTILEPADCNRNWLITIFDSLRFISVEICIKYHIITHSHTGKRAHTHTSWIIHMFGDDFQIFKKDFIEFCDMSRLVVLIEKESAFFLNVCVLLSELGEQKNARWLSPPLWMISQTGDGAKKSIVIHIS